MRNSALPGQPSHEWGLDLATDHGGSSTAPTTKFQVLVGFVRLRTIRMQTMEE